MLSNTFINSHSQVNDQEPEILLVKYLNNVKCLPEIQFFDSSCTNKYE